MNSNLIPFSTNRKAEPKNEQQEQERKTEEKATTLKATVIKSQIRDANKDANACVTTTAGTLHNSG